LKVSNKELGELVAEAEGQGWVVIRRVNNHLKWISPVGQTVFTSGTPSDVRAVKNIKRDLARFGFIKLERKGKKKKWM
jgi:hypothetical protein